MLAAGFASSATISGSIYNAETFELLKDAIVSVNSTPGQQIVSKDANYSFELPFGDFEIRAKYFENSMLVLESSEKIRINKEGNYRLDLIMLPAANDENLEQELLGNQLENFDVNQSELPPAEKDNSWFLLAGILALLIIVMIWVFWKNSGQKAGTVSGTVGESAPKAKPKVLDKNAEEVLQALRERGNRATQKELLEKVHFGEAYLSLVIAELESEGKVKKIKKGRGNIIILKEN